MTTIECPFCSADIIHSVFHESRGMLAVYNIAPILPGHSLVLPKRHVESIFELSQEETGDFFSFAREVTHMLNKAFGTRGFDWSLQESEEAGQTIKHLHLHIIPRKPGDLDQPGDWFPQLEQSKNSSEGSESRPRLSKNQIMEMVQYIKKEWPGNAV